MSHPKRKAFVIVLLGISFLILFSTNSFPWWYVNASEEGFGGGGGDSTDSTSESGTNTAIGDYIVDGAGYFLDSYDKTLIFMKKIELSDKQYVTNDELVNLLDNAMNQMKLAHVTYINLKQLADNTPYNPFVIDALKRFNYDDFMVENSLNGEIFAEVKNFLAKGDIRGVYGKLIFDTAKIIFLLNIVKDKLESGVFPPLKEVWKLNQAFSNSLMFGQNVAQVFNAL